VSGPERGGSFTSDFLFDLWQPIAGRPQWAAPSKGPEAGGLSRRDTPTRARARSRDRGTLVRVPATRPGVGQDAFLSVTAPVGMSDLLGSRYCETDRLSDEAWRLFGHTPLGWPRVQAICDFVHNHITFGYEHSRATRTASEAYVERHGVCRDYAHLAVAFCRSLNIPARYCTGYMTDIGLPPPYAPMDFAAWIEVYLGGRWHTFDPRNNAPRIGRVLIAHGRDAADVPLTHIFGPGTLSGFRVWAEQAPLSFTWAVGL
jgi:transglutaminase-like putative cysteine protease